MNKNDSNKKMPKSVLVFLAFPIVMILLYFMAKGFMPQKTYTYSEIINNFKNEQVVKYEMNLNSGDMHLTLKDGSEIEYNTPSASLMYMDIKDYVESYNSHNPDAPMIYDLNKSKDMSELFSSLLCYVLLPVISMVILGWLFMRRMSAMGMGPGGSMSMNKSRVLVSTGKKVTFDDVAGAVEEKEELQEMVDFLKNPAKYHEVGARIPKGVLLMGPPGTGKTLLSKAVAGEANVPFFSTAGSDFVEMYVGLGAARIRDLFEQAKKKTPCIIFIDEIDAVGKRRETGVNGTEKDNTLNQLLVEMDGFDDRDGIVVMAATNRPDILDKALMRPGRFDRQIYVNYPDVKEREEILKVHARNKPFAPDVKLKTIAKSTAGFTGADLENLMNEAAIITVRAGKKVITMDEIEEASLKVEMGPEKKTHIVNEEEKRLTAYHEGGHALVSYFCKTHDKVQELSIIPRGAAGGYTRYLPEKDESYTSKNRMMEGIMSTLGGMAAEKIIADDTSTGVSSDLRVVTRMARNMVTKYGMSETIGPVVYAYPDGYENGVYENYSDSTAHKIDEEVKKIISDSYEKAKNIISDHMDKLHEIASYLIENEKMSGKKFYEIMDGKNSESDSEINL